MADGLGDRAWMVTQDVRGDGGLAVGSGVRGRSGAVSRWSVMFGCKGTKYRKYET